MNCRARDTMPSGADGIIPLYQRHAAAWAHDRGTALIERAWLDRMRALIPANPEILDLGCGSGDPIARYLINQGAALTGIDTAPAMIALCTEKFSAHHWQLADMRGLALRRRFNALLAWDSFFHLPPDDQRAMFPVFRAHAAAGAALIFTSGTHHGVALGSYAGETLYHASLDPAEYRRRLAEHGFIVIDHKAEDPDCGRRTVWLAQYSG